MSTLLFLLAAGYEQCSWGAVEKVKGMKENKLKCPPTSPDMTGWAQRTRVVHMWIYFWVHLFSPPSLIDCHTKSSYWSLWVVFFNIESQCIESCRLDIDQQSKNKQTQMSKWKQIFCDVSLFNFHIISITLYFWIWTFLSLSYTAERQDQWWCHLL